MSPPDLVHGVLKSERVEEALRRVDRKHYCRTRAFEDSPQPIGLSGVCIAGKDFRITPCLIMHPII